MSGEFQASVDRSKTDFDASTSRSDYSQFEEWQRSRQESQDAGTPARNAGPNAQNVAQPQQEEAKDEEAPEDAFSHYLVLSDGTHVRYDVGNDPYAPFPSEWNGKRVASVHGF
jgi:hypothetical protein